jgi:hypothetical protein
VGLLLSHLDLYAHFAFEFCFRAPDTIIPQPLLRKGKVLLTSPA